MPLRLRLLSSPSPLVGDGASPVDGSPVDGSPVDGSPVDGSPVDERAIELPDDAREIRIGRRPDVELPLPYPALSGLHARLVRSDDRWQIEDLGSTNGTRVDGERLAPRQPRPIAPGAQITLGQITLVFDGTVGAVAGAERTATIARRLVSDLFAASPDMATPTLTIVSGVPPRPPLRLETTGRRYVAGRGETCDLQLLSDEISREHAEIVRLWDGVVVGDLGSKNGVRVNDTVVTGRQQLRDGDLVQVGPATLRLSDPADRYLRDFEARAPQRQEPAVEAAGPAAATASLDAAADPAPQQATPSPATPSENRPVRRAGGSRTSIVVAAIVLIIVGAMIVTLLL
jgi:pSer/pThr/pTyr-binding forkhead associated (FHA) protein